MIDKSATDVHVAGGVLLATGWSWDPATGDGESIAWSTSTPAGRYRYAARFRSRRS